MYSTSVSPHRTPQTLTSNDQAGNVLPATARFSSPLKTFSLALFGCLAGRLLLWLRCAVVVSMQCRRFCHPNLHTHTHNIAQAQRRQIKFPNLFIYLMPQRASVQAPRAPRLYHETSHWRVRTTRTMTTTTVAMTTHPTNSNETPSANHVPSDNPTHI